jgi:hypothetical protein
MRADSRTRINPLERKSQRTTSLRLEPAKTFAQLRILRHIFVAWETVLLDELEKAGYGFI